MVGIEDVDLSVRNRSPDGHRLALFNQRVGRVRRVLRGTVQVVDFAHAGFLVNLLDQAPGKWFPSQIHYLDRGRHTPTRHQLSHRRRNCVDQGYLVGRRRARQVHGVLDQDQFSPQA